MRGSDKGHYKRREHPLRLQRNIERSSRRWCPAELPAQAGEAGFMLQRDSGVGIKISLNDAALVCAARGLISLSEAFYILLEGAAKDRIGGDRVASECASGVDGVDHEEVR